MFTTYIHTLEVLAMHPEGTTVNKIVSMGSEWSPQHISATLKWLEKEGYVKRWKAGRGYVWQVTEKAIEYCETIVRKYKASHVMDEISEYVESTSQNAIAPTQETITDVSETHNDVNIVQYYTEVTGRCECCDSYVEHHYALCDNCLEDAVSRIGLDAYAYYAMPLDMKIAQRFNPETPETLDCNMPYHVPVNDSDIPF